MGNPHVPKSVKYFASLIFGSDISLREAEGELVSFIGKIEETTGLIPFVHSNYYDKELGERLSRVFLLFEPLLHRELLPDIKLKTNVIERMLSTGSKRTVNIDPGYIALEHVILATTKGYSHRIYLNKGIYGDLTLMYQNGTYKALEWTYPDYREAETIFIMNKWRDIYKRMLKC
ncbi:MAG: DUF4416 family protein [Syntrophobacterales bacterium]|jgi:hypothetical protein|nr:DUF4416 family protein [Syntrophobacterales bacterium]